MTSAAATPAAEPAPEGHEVDGPAARKLLFDDDPSPPCSSGTAGPEPSLDIKCLLQSRYRGHPAELSAALELYRVSGTVAGVERTYTMDGGWRGMIDIVPELPFGRYRRHLSWILAANKDFAQFFKQLGVHSTSPIDYRWRGLGLKFFRSVKRTTPSAYASGWQVGYNVSGSLHSGPAAVRETLFHEVFHLNDRAKDNWSSQTLTELVEGIVKRCQIPGSAKLNSACLRPHAPGDTMVRGGTYYAFQPGNGVWEYAAELAVRYYREQSRMLSTGRLNRPAFKCTKPENAIAWSGLVETFFAGVDLVPACPAKDP